MNPLQPHYHNGTDSPKLPMESIERFPLEAVTEITETADGTYSANEQAMLNALKASLNDLIDKLQSAGVLK